MTPSSARSTVAGSRRSPRTSEKPRVLEQRRDRGAVIEDQPIEHLDRVAGVEQAADEHVADIAGSADDEDGAIG